MKKIIAFALVAVLCCSSSFAQKNTAPKNSVMPGQRSSSSLHKTAIGGVMTDARKRPIPGIQAFIYQADSTIIASGYTDSVGYYETNSVTPGKYDLKIVYPSAISVVVKGVVIKAGVTQVSLKMDPPVADSTFPYTNLLPKKEEKKTTGAKKK